MIEVINVSREPGKRAKIAVRTKDKDIDPVGACVGMRGARVQSVVQELRGEKIDIIPYSDDAVQYVSSALSPAKVSRVIMDEANHAMEVIVPDDQLSLAIGKNGQNVRLAVKLTGWKIDVKSESAEAKKDGPGYSALLTIPEMEEETAELLFDKGLKSIAMIASADREVLSALTGVEESTAQLWIEEAGRIIDEEVAAPRET